MKKTLEKEYIYSLFIGLILFFQLHVISYCNYFLINQGVMSGILDPYLLIKTPLVTIPILFILYFGYGVYKVIEKWKKYYTLIM